MYHSFKIIFTYSVYNAPSSRKEVVVSICFLSTLNTGSTIGYRGAMSNDNLRLVSRATLVLGRSVKILSGGCIEDFTVEDVCDAVFFATSTEIIAWIWAETTAWMLAETTDLTTREKILCIIVFGLKR